MPRALQQRGFHRLSQLPDATGQSLSDTILVFYLVFYQECKNGRATDPEAQ